LSEAGLIPSKMAGSSAGALISAAFASGLPIEEAKRIVFALRRHDILLSWLEAGPTPAIFSVKRDSPLVTALPVKLLEECKTPVAISTFSMKTGQTRVFTRGPIADVVVASCTVPVLIEPAKIQDEDGLFLDGGVRDIAGLHGCDPSERVLYHHATVAPLWMTHANKFGPDHLKVLRIPGLPIVTPLTMGRGPQAFDIAYRSTQLALSQIVSDDHIIVPKLTQARL